MNIFKKLWLFIFLSCSVSFCQSSDEIDNYDYVDIKTFHRATTLESLIAVTSASSPTRNNSSYRFQNSSAQANILYSEKLNPCDIYYRYTQFTAHSWHPSYVGGALKAFRRAYRSFCLLRHLQETAGNFFTLRKDIFNQKRKSQYDLTKSKLNSGRYEDALKAIRSLGILGHNQNEKEELKKLIRSLSQEGSNPAFTNPQRRKLIQSLNFYERESIAPHMLIYTKKPGSYEQERGLFSWSPNGNRIYLISESFAAGSYLLYFNPTSKNRKRRV